MHKNVHGGEHIKPHRTGLTWAHLAEAVRVCIDKGLIPHDWNYVLHDADGCREMKYPHHVEYEYLINAELRRLFP